jgi:DNA-binding helix-hairpin-helix protein with protein kinase domain
MTSSHTDSAALELLREFMKTCSQNECHVCDGVDSECPKTCWDRRARAVLAEADASTSDEVRS